ncbi:hypothetical protein JW859_07275 [bacterium]|nr:hypothetical protein [bacterium]
MHALWNIIITLCWPLLYLYPPFRGTIGKRLGGFELGAYDPAAAGLKVLINAVSAGEVVAITPLVHELRARCPAVQIVMLTTTASGQTMAREKLGSAVDLLAYFPLIDLPFVVRRYLDRLLPDVYISTESELWPNIMAECNRRGIPVVLANARIYLHNKQGWRGRLHHRLLALVDRLLCQSEEQHANFVKFGIDPAKLATTGNIKFDFALPDWDAAHLADWRAKWGLDDEQVVVIGSTHEGEEQLLLKALSHLDEHPKWEGEPRRRRIILAPRHVERVEEVRRIAAGLGYAAMTMAEVEAGDGDWQVLIVDRYGVLVDMYRLADLVIMGGTFNQKVGGHNLLEATALGKPVFIGPYTFSITAQVRMLKAEQAVSCMADFDDLGAQTAQLLAFDLSHPVRLVEIGRLAQQLTLANRGAAAKSATEVLALAAKKPAD